MEQEQPCINPIEDQRKQALAHYEEASRSISHWSSFVEAAIKAYNPNPSPPTDKEAILKKYTYSNILPYSQWLHAAMDEYAASLIKERDELKEKALEGLLFKVTAKNVFPDPTIFYIKSIDGNEVDVCWQDIHGRGERTTHYVLSDVKSKLKFGDWTEVKPEEISQLQSSNEAKEKECEYWKQRCEAAEVVLKSFPNSVLEDQAGEDYLDYEKLKNKT